MFSIIINFAAVYHRLYSVRSSFRELFFLATTIEFEEQETLIHSCNVNVTMYYHIYRCSNICYVCRFPEKVDWLTFFNPRKVPSCSLGVSRTYITIIKFKKKLHFTARLSEKSLVYSWTIPAAQASSSWAFWSWNFGKVLPVLLGYF